MPCFAGYSFMMQNLPQDPKLSDYALIGNSRAAALVCTTGAIEWCCLPEFDSPSIFASLLDRKKGGHFSIAPMAGYKSSQRYLPDSNVVETSFETEEGKVRLTDAFTAMSEDEKEQSLFPEHEILRVVEADSGEVRLELQYAPRTYYGKNAPHLEDRRKLGIHFSWKGQNFNLLSTLEEEEIRIKDNHTAIAEFSLKKGERLIFSLSYSNQSPAILPELATTGWKRMESTIRYWKSWIGNCRYKGRYQEHVRRSALLLKLLAHAPSGAIIAAPTTSLPEQVGGVRNWDYRYCWLRDASFTVRALMALGFEEETRAYMNWILHATRLTRPRLQVLYSIYGHASLKEKRLNWLEGFRNSSPVRVGNDADGQFQLDLYGEVLDAIYAYSPLVESFDRSTRKFILGLGKAIFQLWDQPDNGIWEVRSQCIHHTHSKAMAWVGLDRLMKLAKKYKWTEAPLEEYHQLATRIRNEIEQFGYNEELKSYTRAFSGETLDASILTLPLTGYCKPDEPRMVSTCEAIYQHLSKNELIYRYQNIDDGLPGNEGSFGICNFWLAENLARAGEIKKAIHFFETMLEHSGPTGLWSEEIEPDTLEFLGNYPQAFTHIGLINAALAINEVCRKGGKKG
jgi:GH15 family glucan-1,4-alpha-glucosidase